MIIVWIPEALVITETGTEWTEAANREENLVKGIDKSLTFSVSLCIDPVSG